jgi:hypothetical protein
MVVAPGPRRDTAHIPAASFVPLPGSMHHAPVGSPVQARSSTSHDPSHSLNSPALSLWKEITQMNNMCAAPFPVYQPAN